MADQMDIDLAVLILDELTDRLNNNIKSGGFNNETVMWLIKAWTKVGIRTQGAGFHRRASAYYVMKREPSQIQGKRSKHLLSMMDAYQTMLQNHKITGGDYFNRADKAMLDFVWDYRQHISGTTEKEFVGMLMKWMSLSADEVLKQVVTQMDRAA